MVALILASGQLLVHVVRPPQFLLMSVSMHVCNGVGSIAAGKGSGIRRGKNRNSRDTQTQGHKLQYPGTWRHHMHVVTGRKDVARVRAASLAPCMRTGEPLKLVPAGSSAQRRLPPAPRSARIQTVVQG